MSGNDGLQTAQEYTREIIKSAMNGKLERASYKEHEVFGLQMPTSCPGVPDRLLNPKSTWAEAKLYDATANDLAIKFTNNFKQFENQATKEILAAAPRTFIDA